MVPLLPDPPERKEIGNRALKERLVKESRAHAALVFDGDEAVAWAEYGSIDPNDLPPDKKISSSFLYNATRTMCERLGFSDERPKRQGN